MKSYQCTFVFSSPARKVYDALTTAEGIRSWFTTSCEVGTGLGAECTFRFGKSFNVVRIERLVPGIEVRWRCLQQYHHAPGQLARPDEWINTLMVFRLLSPTPSNTLLEFEHIGLMPGLECYDISERNWDHYLKRSLKNYIETGIGEPFDEPS